MTWNFSDHPKSNANSLNGEVNADRCVKCGVNRVCESGLMQLCPECLSQKASYTKNSARMGTPDKLPTFSFEFEIAFPEDEEDEHRPHYCCEACDGDYDDWVAYQRRGKGFIGQPEKLLLYGFEHCSDGTVQAEYKSPIYVGLDAFEEVLPVLDELRENVTYAAGTHIHVGMKRQAINRLRSQFNKVFDNLEAEMEHDPHEAEDFWGRDCGRWCYGRGHSHHDRYHWLNTSTGQDTIEYRIPRFKTAEQFSRVVAFVRMLTAMLEDELSRPRSDEAYERISQAVLDMYTACVEQEGVTA